MTDIMTPEEVADLLRVNVRSVYRWAERGELPAIRIGRTVRFLRADVEAIVYPPRWAPGGQTDGADVTPGATSVNVPPLSSQLRA